MSASHAVGPSNDRDLGGICNYIMSKNQGRLEEDKRRSYSEPSAIRGRNGHSKLHKPPQVQSIQERPRNRLRKQFLSYETPLPSTPALFILEYEPYPHLTQPSKVLGIYSSFDSVTLGAFKHGAYTFSREGLLDGSEYLSPTGRIRIVRTDVQRSGVKAVLPERSQSLNGEHIRLDIPHPQGHEEAAREPPIGRDIVFLAVREGPNAASWMGVYEEKSLAWGACLKDKSMCAMTATLCDELRSIGINNMPQVSGRLVGSGRYTWMVQQHSVDGSVPS
jgi:hypothetical protein